MWYSTPNFVGAVQAAAPFTFGAVLLIVIYVYFFAETDGRG